MVGNWKCNGNLISIGRLIEELNKCTVGADVEIVCAPAMPHLTFVRAMLDQKFALAAQNCWSGSGGAFTGEVSADILIDIDVKWVILGHSERRTHLHESDEFVAKKVAYAVSSGLKVVVCIGETLAEHLAGNALKVCDRQLRAVATHLSFSKSWKNILRR